MIPLKDDNPTSSRPIVTYFLIGLCVVVFLMEIGSESFKTGYLIHRYGLIPSVLMGHGHDLLPRDFFVLPAYLTIITSMFMHGGWIHLIGNMWYMKIFADNIEDNLGSRNFIIFYILCGIGAAMAQVLTDTHSQVPMVGASGAIVGVLGAYLINYPNARVLVLIPFIIITIIKIRALYVLGFWFILQFISSDGGVAYAAHIGGFVTGMILMLFFNKKINKKSYKPKIKRVKKVNKGPWEQ
jgi:membrane associated rhomboid family serine protease